HAGGRSLTFVEVVGGERRELEKGRAGVEERVDALAGKQLAALLVPLAMLLGAAPAGVLQALPQILRGRGVVRKVLLELGGRRADLRLDAVHARRAPISKFSAKRKACRERRNGSRRLRSRVRCVAGPSEARWRARRRRSPASRGRDDRRCRSPYAETPRRRASAPSRLVPRAASRCAGVRPLRGRPGNRGSEALHHRRSRKSSPIARAPRREAPASGGSRFARSPRGGRRNLPAARARSSATATASSTSCGTGAR